MNSLNCPKIKSLSYCLTELFPIYQSNIGPSDGGTIIPSTHRPTVLYWRLSDFKVWHVISMLFRMNSSGVTLSSLIRVELGHYFHFHLNYLFGAPLTRAFFLEFFSGPLLDFNLQTIRSQVAFFRKLKRVTKKKPVVYGSFTFFVGSKKPL